MRISTRLRQIFGLQIFLITLLLGGKAGAQSTGRVDVVLWFDTEDYLLPADDDACKRLADMLTAKGVKATFKVVGEKARVLEKRGRKDVIEALQRHDIAFHANFHSVHPTPSEYLADCGWLDGIDEFVRREGWGASDVRRIFGVDSLSCYGQPGSSWAPQAIAALGTIGVTAHGVPCYVDEGDHVGLNEQPFWYAGALIVYHMGRNYTRMELHDADDVISAKERVSNIARRLSEGGGGLISIFYHPCEWVHKEFWDGVNFRRGANPPREQWRPPPQRTAAETDRAFERFGKYIDYILTIPGVRFVTARDLPEIYTDLSVTQGASRNDVAELSARLIASAGKSTEFQVLAESSYSLADQFEILLQAVLPLVNGTRTSFPIKVTRCAGPEAPPPGPSTGQSISWLAFRDSVRDVAGFLNSQHRIPSRVFLGASAVSPMEYLLALARVYKDVGSDTSGAHLNEVQFGLTAEVGPVRFVATDTPGLFGEWVIHREGFRAPRILEMARLQAWTLKPALRNVVR